MIVQPVRYSNTRARDRRRVRKEIESQYFSSASEVPMVFPMGYGEKRYAGEVLSTSKGVLEVTTERDNWIPRANIPVVSMDELCRERLRSIVAREGHLISVCEKQRKPWGFQIRDFTEHHYYVPENKLDAAADRILALAGWADELNISSQRKN